MTREEFELLIEVALTVMDMVPPEIKKNIERRINNLRDNEEDDAPRI